MSFLMRTSWVVHRRHELLLCLALRPPAACLCWPEELHLSVQVSELIYGRLQQLLAGAEDTWGIVMPWLPQRVQEVPGGVWCMHGCSITILGN